MRHIKNGGSLCYPTNHPSFITRAWPSVTSVSSSSATRSGGAAAKAAATWAAIAGQASLPGALPYLPGYRDHHLSAKWWYN